MAISPFYSDYIGEEDAELLNELIQESIQQRGLQAYYLVRENVNVSEIFNEEQVAGFQQSFLLEMYLENIAGFGGDRSFLGTFGPEVRDRITLIVSIDRFKTEVGNVVNYSRPHEGDVIYLPLTGGLYEIKFVEPETYFYQLGKLYTYSLVLESFEYNNETFDTGIPEIDAIADNYATNANPAYLLDEDGAVILDEYGNPLITEDYSLSGQDPFSQNETFDNDVLDILDFSIQSPFSESTR